MKARPARRDGFSLLGVGALACAACCAGPILAFLGALSLAGLASTALVRGAGLVIAFGALAAYVMRRRQHRSRDARTGPVRVDLSRKRA